MRTSLFDMLTINTVTHPQKNGRMARVPVDLTALSFNVSFLPQLLSFVIFVPGLMHKVSRSHTRFCPRACLSASRWAKPTTHRHKGPHSAGGPCSNALLITAACVSSPSEWAVSIDSHMQQKADCKVRRRHGLGPLTNWRSFSPRNRCFQCALHRVFNAPPGARQCTKCVFRYSPINDPGGNFAIHERRFFRAPFHFESFNSAW